MITKKTENRTGSKQKELKAICQKYGHSWGDYFYMGQHQTSEFAYYGVIYWAGLVMPDVVNGNHCWLAVCNVCGVKSLKLSASAATPDATEAMVIVAREEIKNTEDKKETERKRANFIPPAIRDWSFWGTIK